MQRIIRAALSSLVVFVVAAPALASYHEMKIEQAIGGVAGNTNQQAIQLRMRAVGQELVGNQARLIVRDATGSNPVTLLVFTSNAAIGNLGSRILIASAAFAAAQPGITADFTMTNTIPSSYLAAGRLTYEDNVGTVLWSLAWGGGSYTGSNLGDPSHFNDADGNFGPPFASALPSTTAQALRFTTADPSGAASSTNNAADYGVTAGAAVFTNNAGASSPVALPQSDLSVTKTAIPDPVAPSQPVTYTITVTNAGPATATSVLVSDTLPPGTVFMGASGTGWTCAVSPGNASCNRASLAVGTAPIITMVLGAPAAPGPITNTVTVSSVAVTDSNPANNTATAVTQVSSTPGQADLSITKSDGGLEGRYGFPLTYTIAATNGGPASVGGAAVADTFPAGLSNVTWTCTATAGSSCPASGTGNIAALVSLMSGGTATFVATGTVVTGTLSPLLNTATVEAPSGVVDPTPGNNSATESTVVGPIAFNTVAPCRLADTRDPNGPRGGPALAANAARSFPVTNLCGIPADARAVSINVTVVGPTDLGDLRIYPAGGAAPLASVVNFSAGAVRANNAIIGLGTGGQIAVQCDMPLGSTGVTHFLIDVNAYFR